MREENNRRKEFEDIAMEHIDSLYSMAIRLVFNKDEAEDLVQETYLKAYRFFDTFQKGTNIKAWLFKILRNTFINKYRKTVNLPSEIFYEDVESVNSNLSYKQESDSGELTDTLESKYSELGNLMEDDVKRAIDSLPIEYKEAILLSDVEELSYNDIAEITNVPIGTVKSRLNRGRKLLQKSLWEYAKDRGFIKRGEMMVCVEAIKHLYEFMDKEIDKSQYPIIKEHLDNCFECRQRYEFEKGVRSLVKAYCINTTAPAYLHSKIVESLYSVGAEISENKDMQAISEQKVPRTLFLPRFYAVAASLLLLIAGGVFYYAHYYNNSDPISIVDNAVKNHVVAVNDNLVFNEKTSVVGNVNKYLGNNINTKLSNSSPLLNAERVSIVGGIPVKFGGTSSPCVIFDKGEINFRFKLYAIAVFPSEISKVSNWVPKNFI